MGRLDLCLHKPGTSRCPEEAGMVPARPLQRARPCPLTPQPGFCPSTASSGATLSRALEDTGLGGRGPRDPECVWNSMVLVACPLSSPVLPHPRRGWRG